MLSRFTILTATFNKPTYLLEAAQRVIAQTVSDWQWWIVLDGPTPETELAAVSLTNDSRISLFHEATTDDHRSRCYRPAEIFDAYMPRALSPYLCWLSDDDLWEPDFLERLVGPMQADKSVNVTCGGARILFKKDELWNFVREVHPMGMNQNQLLRSMGSDATLFRRDAYHMAGLPKATAAERTEVTDKVVLRALAPLTAVSGIVMTHRVTERSAHRLQFITKEKGRQKRSAQRAKRLRGGE